MPRRRPPSPPPPPPPRRKRILRPNTLLSLPPDLLRLIFHHLLSAPSLPPVLSGRVVTDSADAFQLASTCTHLRRLFRSSISHLHVDWDTPIYLHTLATLFGPSLRHLRLRDHARADAFLLRLARLPVPPPLHSLALQNCAAPPAALAALLSAAAPLRDLRLHFVDTPNLSAVLISVAPSLHALHTLHLRGLSQLTHAALVAVCGATGSTLRRLALRYVRHASVGDATLAAVAGVCTGVSKLFLEDVRHASAQGVVQMCRQYAGRLRALRLYACGMRVGELRAVLRECGGLEELGVEEATWAADVAGRVAEAVAEVAAGLQVLHLRDVNGLTDADVRKMVRGRGGGGLTHVAVRRQEFVTDSMMFEVGRLGERLRHLDVRGCFVTDYGLEEVGRRCRRLEAVFLGGDGQDLSEEGAARVRMDAISDVGMERMLEGCGTGLKSFTWETPKRVTRSATGRDYRVAVGVAQLSAKAMAKTLTARCPNLLFVEVNGLRPPARERVERARCDLAFIELEEAVKHVVVYIDREQPF